MEPLIITLDGPAGSGKSTIARALAARLGIEFLDTGAMYRGLTAILIDRGIPISSPASVIVSVMEGAMIRFDWSKHPPALMNHAQDLTGRLRDPDVTASVSQIASVGEVRMLMVNSQRAIGRDHPRMVTEGRDQGSVVFPHAAVKFFLDARAEVRAKRRAIQFREAGKPADEAAILKAILERDLRDSTRKNGPLIIPVEAIRIDTSEMDQEQVLEQLVKDVLERVPQRLEPKILEALRQGEQGSSTGASRHV